MNEPDAKPIPEADTQATPPMEDPQASYNENAQKVENFLEIYATTAEWIRFADAKAAAVLTVCGALAALLIPTLRGYFGDEGLDDAKYHAVWTTLVLCFFVGWLALLMMSGLTAFTCIIPFRRRGKHPAIKHAPHFHAASVATHYSLDDVEKFTADCEALGYDGIRREIIAAILIDSHVSDLKYKRVTRSIKILGLSVVFALVYLILIQF